MFIGLVLITLQHKYVKYVVSMGSYADWMCGCRSAGFLMLTVVVELNSYKEIGYSTDHPHPDNANIRALFHQRSMQGHQSTTGFGSHKKRSITLWVS